MKRVDEEQGTIHTQLLDSLPDAVAWLEPVFAEQNGQIVDFQFSYCNQKVQEMTGTGFNAEVGSLLLGHNQAHSTFAKALYQQYIEVYETGQSKEYTYQNPITQTYLHVIRRRWRTGVLSITRDRTVEKQTEQQAEMIRQKHTEQLQFVTDSALTAIALYAIIRDPSTNEVVDLRYELINQMAERMTGRKANELIGHTMREVFEGIEKSGIWKVYKQLAETGTPVRYHNHYVFDGYDIWYEVQGVRKDEFIVLSFLDISELKRSQQEKQKQADLLNSLLDNSPVAFAQHQTIRNPTGEITDFRYLRVNQSFSRIAGISIDEILTKTVLEMSPSTHHNGLLEKFINVVETGQPLELERHVNNRWYQISFVKFDDGFISAAIDINQSHEYRQQLEATNNELRRSNESLQQFAYVASHDLQEPLRKIQSFGDLLINQYEGALGENGQDLLRRMQLAAMRMSVLINDLLTYSRIATHREPFQSVALKSILKEVLDDLVVTIRETNAVISVEALPTITGDASQLRQLFQNLITNSLKFRKPGIAPAIHIHCRQVQGPYLPDKLQPTEKAFYDIVVSDNGIGFSPKYADQIFEVFQRLHSKQQFAGTGVGLSICKRVAENHGGTITAESSPDQGATFHVFLPDIGQ